MVSTPLVQNRSLIASGMPSSGRASPRAEPRVGGRGHRQRLLRRLGDEGVERPRRLDRGDIAPSASSRAENCFARSPSRASARVRSVSVASLDHLRHGEEAAAPAAARCRGSRRGDRRRSPRRRASAGVIAATLVIGATPVGIDLVELLDPGQDAATARRRAARARPRQAGCAPAWRYAPRWPCPMPCISSVFSHGTKRGRKAPTLSSGMILDNPRELRAAVPPGARLHRARCRHQDDRPRAQRHAAGHRQPARDDPPAPVSRRRGGAVRADRPAWGRRARDRPAAGARRRRQRRAPNRCGSSRATCWRLRDLPVAFWDERLSTAAVTREMIAARHDPQAPRRDRRPGRRRLYPAGLPRRDRTPRPMHRKARLSRALRLARPAARGRRSRLACRACRSGRADRRFPANRLGFSRDPGGARGDDPDQCRRLAVSRAAPGPARLRDLRLLRWICEAINATLPAAQIGGDVVRARLLQQRIAAPARGAASVAVDFCMTIVAEILFTVLGFVLLAWLGAEASWWPVIGQRRAAAAFRLVQLGAAGQTAAARRLAAPPAALRSPPARRVAPVA